MTDTVEVTQADRDAAANWLQAIDDDGHTYDAIRRGECDSMDLVQAFARHRIAAAKETATAERERCAKVAEVLPLQATEAHSTYFTHANDIATAIRALGDE